MTEPVATHCSVCGRPTEEPVSLPPVGSLCAECLLQGRFFGTGAGLRLSAAAEKIVELSPTARTLLAAVVGPAEEQARRRSFDAARGLFIEQARLFRNQGRPLLAAALMQRALRLPGPSVDVYQELALAALSMNCHREAIQYLKTASWLALKVGQDDLLDKILEQLEELCPGDRWMERARGRASSRDVAPELRCRYCGRTAAAAGELVRQGDSAACSECLERLKRLSPADG